MRLTILDKYILSSYVPLFIIAQAVLSLIIGAGQSDIVGRVDLSNHVLACPVAGAFAACLLFSDLAKYGELRALSAGGISLGRLIISPASFTIAIIAVLALTSGFTSTVTDVFLYKGLVAVCGGVVSVTIAAILASKFARLDPGAAWLGSFGFIVAFYICALLIAVFSRQLVLSSVIVLSISVLAMLAIGWLQAIRAKP